MTAPYYQDTLVTLYHGDCLEIVPTLVETFDLVVTSPPYNLGQSPWPALGHWKPGDKQSGGRGRWSGGADAAVGVEYTHGADSIPHSEYVAWQRQVLAACWAVLTDDGAIFYNHKPRVIGTRLWLPTELTEGLPLRQIITWARSGGTNPLPTAYMPTYEWVMVLARESWRLRDRSASGVGDVWKVAQDQGNAHPAPFPLAIPANAIETSGAKSVLDPFAGSGTTLLAARERGVQSIGVERSEAYCEMAAKRLQRSTAQTLSFDIRDGAA